MGGKRKKKATISRYRYVPRVALVGFILSMFLFPYDVATHAYGHFMGSIVHTMISGEWHIVALNIALFCGFLLPLAYRRKVDWKEYSIVVAFFVSLFIEMYGIPLTIMFMAGALNPVADAGMRSALGIEIFGVTFHFTVPMVYGSALMIVGMLLILIGWITLYKGVKKGDEGTLVTTGIYSASRNPQYLGFIFIIIGWLIGWPTLITVIFSPILIFLYIRLCKVEEKEISDLEGFKEYRKRVLLII